ncbi:hypothetical protein [Pseudogemmobacter sonorensis]|uniref:hypothetical protein n=1 Tax=Pseudogemmobacter sonorensis TaxID=2989681 RepID=UPI0036C4BA85
MAALRLSVAFGLILGLAPPALAKPPAPQSAEFLEILDVGLYCRPPVERTEEAPGTTLGYVNLTVGAPEILYSQQQVPATLGVSFGLIFVSDETILDARMETHRPGAETPDIWYSNLFAGSSSSRGFTFEFEEELRLGRWRLEAWEEERLVYRVEFDVVPAGEAPGNTADHCNPMS